MPSDFNKPNKSSKPGTPGDRDAPSTGEVFHPRGSQHPARAFAQVLGVIAAVAIVVVAVRMTPRSATAGDEVTTGLANPIDQRNAMIAELRTLNLRLERIETRLGAAPQSDQPGG